MAIQKFYRIVTPKAAKLSLTDNQDTVSSAGLYGNYTWYHKLIQGSSVRLMRYREFDLMAADVQVSRALDIIAEEITGRPTDEDLPLKIILDDEMAGQMPSQEVVTLRAALRSWSNINNWKTRLFYIARTAIKYGDCFFMKTKDKNRRMIYVNPKNVIGAIVDKDDVTNIRGWQMRTDYLQTNEPLNLSYTIYANDQPNSYNVDNYDKDDIVRFSLNDETSEEAPFGSSILANVYRDFKRKELLEDAIIIYRIQRAPEKRVFKIDVGKMPPHQIAGHLEQIKNEIKQKKIPSPYGGRNQVESIYNSQMMTEDFFFAKKADGQGSEVNVLPAGQNLGELADLEYFYDKVWIGLKIPKSYLDNTTNGQPYNDGAVGVAYMAELQFNDYIKRMQVHFTYVLDREFKTFLLEKNIMIDSSKFRIELHEPSNFAAYKQQAINSALISTYNNISDKEHISKRFSMKKYLGWTEDDIATNERHKAEEMGLSPNDRRNNLVKIYSPDTGETSGFQGGLGGGFDNAVSPQMMSDTNPDEFKEDKNNNMKNSDDGESLLNKEKINNQDLEMERQSGEVETFNQ